MIHDLGKIAVPAAILAKPGRLTEAEMATIRDHPQKGHDALAGRRYPWPLAEMVLQHHERLDGSGYPHGLKGEAILPEAQIIAVADVVHAMALPRPYRAALGLDAALDELRRGRGRAYGPRVVDICLRLFAERRYRLSEARIAD